MAWTVTVTRGYTMVAGAKPSVDDWNAAFLPTIVVAGDVGGSDIADGAITYSHLNPNFVLGGDAISAVALNDYFLLGDTSAGDNAIASFQSVLQSMFSVTYPSDIQAYDGDLVLLWDVDGAVPYSMNTWRLFSKMMEQAPKKTATVQDDNVLIRDSEAAEGMQAKEVSLRNLLPDIVTAQTVNEPTQIVIDAKGRVTSISGTEGEQRFTSAETALPSGVGSANQVQVAHGLGSTPRNVEVWLKCTDAGGDAGYSQNAIIHFSQVTFDTGSSDTRLMVVMKDATNVTVVFPTGTDYVANYGTGALGAFDATKWKFIVEARL